MPANLSTHLPIIPVSTISGNAEKVFNYVEGASQTYVVGAPLVLSSGAVVVASSNFSTAAPIVGFSALPGRNYGSAGLGASPLFGSVGQPGGVTTGSVQNQSSAVNVLHGGPFFDGLAPVFQAVPDTIFEVQVDNSAGGTFNVTTSNVGQFCALVKDAGGTWYADINTMSGTPGTLPFVIVSLNPQDLSGTSITTQVANGRIRIQTRPTASAVLGS